MRADERVPIRVGYDAAWLQAFLQRASGLVFDEAQTAQVAALAERKLVDLFEVAEETAVANGRTRVLHQDLPLTKGLRALLGEVETRARDVELQPLPELLAQARVASSIDALVRAEIPRLMTALLVLAGRVIAILEPETMSPLERIERLERTVPNQPTRWELERAACVLNLTL